MADLVPAHLDHRRLWADFDYCYPVLSRRSKGVSLGVNLNPDKACNFDCVYCEVDRTTPPNRKDIDLDQLEREMAALLDLTLDGTLFRVAPFDSARPEQRRLNDIAFSGDGEPTTAPEFADAVDRIAHLKWARGLAEVKLVLITDTSRLTARDVVRGLDVLMANNGEIWAKLDAGTEAYYREINRTAIPFAKILESLETTARLRPVTIQSLFLAWKGEGPSEAEIAAYCERLAFLRRMGGQLQGVQLYTVARPTPEAEARPLKAEALDALAAQVRAALPDLPVEVFYGPEDWPELNVHGR
jgi:wyosine [tRNA(Phe)-imidazoG37] synthetase (radical SAM superfamily)